MLIDIFNIVVGENYVIIEFNNKKFFYSLFTYIYSMDKKITTYITGIITFVLTSRINYVLYVYPYNTTCKYKNKKEGYNEKEDSKY